MKKSFTVILFVILLNSFIFSYTGEVGFIEPSKSSDSNIIWFSGYETFDGSNQSSWTPAWGLEYGPDPASQHSIVSTNVLFGNYCARVTYPMGTYSSPGGCQYRSNFGLYPIPAAPREEAYVRYYVRFDPDFNFVQGGKLPGLCGAGCNTGGSKPNGYDGWSARIMWRGNGKVVQYVYHIDQPTTYGEDFEWNLNCQKYFIPGKWHCVETYIKMNTVTGGVGDYNGIVRSWFDGELALDRTNVRFRHTTSIQIDKFYFSTFFGGDDPSWAPVKDEHAQFDNFIISDAPIGPCTDCTIPPPPTPTPTPVLVETLSARVFDSDNLGWNTVSWSGTYNFNDSSKNHTPGGSESLSIQYVAGSWGAAGFDAGSASPFNITPYSHLEFWVNPSNCNVIFRTTFRDVTTGNDIGNQIVVSGSPQWFPLTGQWDVGNWNLIRIPISAFGLTPSQMQDIDRIMFKSDNNLGAPVFNVDDVRLVNYVTATYTQTTQASTNTFTSTPTNTRTNTPTNTGTNTLTNTATSTRTNTPTNSGTNTFTYTATFTRTNTLTNTSSFTSTASPTPTYTNTPSSPWAADKSIDNFDKTPSYLYIAGYGGTASGTLDNSDFLEGTGSLRVNYTLNNGAGYFAEIIANYGASTQDWSFMAYGISITVKGQAGLNDTFRLMIYEDNDMDGTFEETGEEVWNYVNTTVLNNSNWVTLIIPWTSFVKFSGTGNDIIDLNRIGKWRIRIDSSGTAHSGTVRIDDFRRLTTFNQPINNAILTGAFYQIWNGAGCNCGNWTQDEWNNALQRMKDVCMDTIYVQYSVWEDNAWYNASPSISWITYRNPTIDRIFNAAALKGMKVVLGLYFSESWNTANKSDPATYSALLAREQQIIDDLWSQYGSNPAFYGWYIPQEFDDYNFNSDPAKTLVANYFRDVANYCKSKSAAKPVMISSFFGTAGTMYSGPNKPADFELAWWNDFLSIATNIDMVIPQDGVGAGKNDGDTDVPQYYQAINTACSNYGRIFGANVESYKMQGANLVPADIDTFKKQLWVAGTLTNLIITWEWANMDPTLGVAQAQLYNDYRTYQQAANPCWTNTPTFTATQSFTNTETPTDTIYYTWTPTFTYTDTPTVTVTYTLSSTPTDTFTPGPPCACPDYVGRKILGAYQVDYSGYCNGNKIILSGEAIAESFAIYVQSTTGGQMRMALYSDNSGTPENLLVESASVIVTTGWNIIDIPDIYLAAGTYWLFYQNEAGIKVRVDAGANGDEAYFDYAYGPFPSTLTMVQYANGRYSMYVNICPYVCGTPTNTATETPTAIGTCVCPAKLGRETVGSNAFNTGANIAANKYTLTGDAILQSMAVNIITGTGNVRVGIYTDTGNNPGLLVAQSEEAAVVPGWNEITMPQVYLTAGDYWLAFVKDNSSLSLAQDVGVTGDERYGPCPYGPLPETWTNPQPYNGLWTMYANVCPIICPATETPTETVTGTQPATWTPTNTMTFTATDTYSETPTNTVTNTVSLTNTLTPIPTNTATFTDIIDDFEDGEFNINNWGGLWTQWAATSSNVTRVVTTDVPAGGGSYAGHISGDVIGSGWPSIAVSTDLNASGTEMDLSSAQGIRLYMKGNKGTGTVVDFLIQLVTTNITDYSYWRYNYSPTGNWTYIDIPWSSFVAPSWGQGAGMTLTDILQHIRAIQFAIADGTGGTANNTGNNWYIDQIEIYTGTAVNTATPTQTSTQIPTNTLTATPTNTFTATMINTASITFTPTYTQTQMIATVTPTEAEKLEIKDVIISPNPANMKTNLNIKFEITKRINYANIRIYTAAMRLIYEMVVEKEYAQGNNTIIIEAKKLNQMGNGVYYYILTVKDKQNKEARYNRGKMVIIK